MKHTSPPSGYTKGTRVIQYNVCVMMMDTLNKLREWIYYLFIYFFHAGQDSTALLSPVSINKGVVRNRWWRNSSSEWPNQATMLALLLSRYIACVQPPTCLNLELFFETSCHTRLYTTRVCLKIFGLNNISIFEQMTKYHVLGGGLTCRLTLV